MLIGIAEYYTRTGLAEECGCTARTIERHVKIGTAKLNRAAEKIPGMGIRINGRLAVKFIAMMKARTAK